MVEAMAALEPEMATVEYDVISSTQVEAARIRAGLARMLHVDLEDVRVDSTDTDVLGAFVWVSASSLALLRDRILGPSL